jgi:transposase
VTGERPPSYEELAALVVEQAKVIEQLQGENGELRAANGRLESRVAELERSAGQNSGNSGKPPSRDTAAERQRQAAERRSKAAAAGGKRTRGKQKGAKGKTLELSDTPDEVVHHRPDRCEDCGSALPESADRGYQRRQVVEVPPVTPVVTEHRAHTYRCRCGCETTAPFPDEARAPASYGPRARATIAYLLGRQHVPNRRVVEAMRDLFGLEISIGAVDSVYAEAGRRLGGFVAALVVLLRTLPVLHVDETSDRLETRNCWMHVVTGSLYTLIHASQTRGEAAIDEMGVLRGYRGVIVHDRLAMYWKLKRAKHQACAAHLLRDLADVAVVARQAAWAAGLAALLVEINNACHAARGRVAASVLAALRRARRDGPRRQPRAEAPQARRRRAPLLQPRDRLFDPQDVDPPVHERPRLPDDQQRSGAGAQALQAASEGVRLLPQPRWRRALRQRAQLPRHHPEERRPYPCGAGSPQRLPHMLAWCCGAQPGLRSRIRPRLPRGRSSG